MNESTTNVQLYTTRTMCRLDDMKELLNKIKELEHHDKVHEIFVKQIDDQLAEIHRLLSPVAY